MTKKRDLKRRVRDRQARTGESYMEARRRVLAAKSDEDDGANEVTLTGASAVPPSAPEPAKQVAARVPRTFLAPPDAPIAVVELIDASEEATRAGMRCPVRVWPAVAARVPIATLLARIHDVLVSTAGDPTMATFEGLVLHGERPERSPPAWVRSFESFRRFFHRARAGIGGASEDGKLLAIPIHTADGLVTVVCSTHHDGLTITLPDDPQDVPVIDQPVLVVTIRAAGTADPGTTRPVSDGLVIGRGADCDLRLKDGNVSRRHAGVKLIRGAYYITDLGSTNGVFFKGLAVQNKRIEDGDVFQLGAYELRFSFEPA